MNTNDLLRMRLRAQLISGSSAATPREVVAHLLAMQAQDYAGATWAIGLRLPGSSLADIERALAERTLVRTWPMRGTLHFVAAEDVRWLLALLAPRVLARAARREQQLSLDDTTFKRARELFSAALNGGRSLKRPDAMAMLEAGGVATGGQRGYHILWRLSQEGLLVVGPMEDRQQTFALLDEWLPLGRADAVPVSALREEALARLATRYFAGHGPATVNDLARWADVTKSDARMALEAASASLESAEHDGERYWFASGATWASGEDGVHLLPGFDEYMLGYTGRSHQLGDHLATYGSRVASNGMLAPTIVVDGRAVGVWRRTLTTRTVAFEMTPFERLGKNQRAAIVAEQERYARFVGREVAN